MTEFTDNNKKAHNLNYIFLIFVFVRYLPQKWYATADVHDGCLIGWEIGGQSQSPVGQHVRVGVLWRRPHVAWQRWTGMRGLSQPTTARCRDLLRDPLLRVRHVEGLAELEISQNSSLRHQAGRCWEAPPPRRAVSRVWSRAGIQVCDASGYLPVEPVSSCDYNAGIFGV